MYIPKAFEVKDQERLVQFIRKNSFGILFSHKDNDMQCTHLPFLIENTEGKYRLIGHFAKANPQWKHANNKVLVVFQGPHTYISPSWYKEQNAVPTWNYVAVHFYGELRLIDDQQRIIDIMKQSVDFYESAMEHPWEADFNDSYVEGMMKGIVCFEIVVDRLEGKWKLNQNHSIERQTKVISALKNKGDKSALEVAQLMEENVQAVLNGKRE